MPRDQAAADRPDQASVACRTHAPLAALFFSLQVLLCTTLAAAQSAAPSGEPWLRIETQGEACVSARDLRAEIERLLDGRRPVGVKLRVRASGPRWLIELWHANGQQAQREFPKLPDDCAERLRAVALATVLALEHAVESPLPSEELPAAPPPALTWSLGVHAGASLGQLPTPAPLLGLDARIERGAWVPLELLALVDVRAAQSTLAGSRLSTRQITGGLGTCLGRSRSAWRIDGCLGAELGVVLGYAAALPQAERDLAGSGAVNLGLTARWSPRPQLALTARLEGFVRFWLPRFQVLDADGGLFAAERLSPVGGRLRLGLSWLSR